MYSKKRLAGGVDRRSLFPVYYVYIGRQILNLETRVRFPVPLPQSHLLLPFFLPLTFSGLDSVVAFRRGAKTRQRNTDQAIPIRQIAILRRRICFGDEQENQVTWNPRPLACYILWVA